jgi:acetyl-CoA carboxylase biotin carboxyl carrier protein
VLPELDRLAVLDEDLGDRAGDAPPFVAVGSVVRPDQTVCVIEAMKVFTDIPAGVTGTITEVLVKNGQPVEFGQHLFRVRPA